VEGGVRLDLRLQWVFRLRPHVDAPFTSTAARNGRDLVTSWSRTFGLFAGARLMVSLRVQGPILALETFHAKKIISRKSLVRMLLWLLVQKFRLELHE
jgi:hypothetical protein